MAYILYNLTHLIPVASGRSNFGIVLSEDMRTLGSGKHKIFNTLTDATKRQAKKRILFNGIPYEILRIIETKDATVTSPIDRKKLEELLDSQELEIRSKLREKIEQEKRDHDEKEANILRKRNEDFKREQEEKNEMLKTEVFQRAEDQTKFVNKDGVLSAPVEKYNTIEKVDIERTAEPVAPAPVETVKETEAEIAKAKEQEAAMLHAAKEAINVPIPKEVILDDFPVEAEEPKKVKKAKRARKSKSKDVSGEATEAPTVA